jgi:NAD(P)-dependent dehydrogenase (short-subunit alcohol dehydrogenase family)
MQRQAPERRDMNHPAIAAGRVAVITGGASGIGFAAAQRFVGTGMKVCIADVDAAALADAQRALGPNAIAVQTDVADLAQVERLRDQAFDAFGEVAVLMNNAGTGGGGGPWTGYDGWQRVLGVNLWGVVHGLHAFTQRMIDQGTPCAIVNTGSKQGITNPPGDTAYNVSKAGVKTLTEALAHQLRNVPNCRVTAHLLVPGFTYTGLTKRRIAEKPPAAWYPEQVVDELLRRMACGDFYVICPDNDVTTAMDNARLQWNVDDIVRNRPALSRWHPDYAAEFAQFMKNS